MKFNLFVIPFILGALILFAIIIYKYIRWIKSVDRKQEYFIRKNIFTFKTIRAIGEIIREALIHNKIYKKNPLLGYMHMSLAFGWFLLIVVGMIESSLSSGTLFKEPWLGIFFNYFITTPHGFHMADTLSFIMDLLLLIILSGVMLALIKRMRARFMGMKKTTKHHLYDRLALTSLWFIFPLRLLAESTTSAIHDNGSFLTGSIGNLISGLPVQAMELPLWWAYSMALFFFFVSLPFSRYMHIPTEVVHIFLKNWGVTVGEQYSGYSDIQINSCSRCGICIDPCQLNYACDITNVQSVYFIRDTRYNTLKDEVANNCLMCGRCSESCPVGLDLTMLRQQLRNKQEIPGKLYYNFIKKDNAIETTDVIYFAGCMTHLTPKIIISMKKIFKSAGINYWFMDEENGVCCGRPLRQQGFVQQSKDLVSKNLRIITESGAKLLVTSCPICYKSFKDEYTLSIPVMHHSEYIEQLVMQKKLKLNKTTIKTVYHDPCELGRGANIYDQPRNVLNKFTSLIPSESEREDSLCCGGSLSNTLIELSQQIKIRDNALEELTKHNPDVLITACPLCKKSFIHGNKAKVMDLAEIIADNIITDLNNNTTSSKVNKAELVLN